MRRLLLACITFLLCNPPATPQRQNDARGQGSDELLHATQRADARWFENGNFRLSAKFKILNVKQTPVEGRYRLVWATENQWREEFSAPDFHQVRLRGEGGFWETREPDYPTRAMWNLMQALAFYYRLTPASDEAPGRVYWKKNNGSAFRCLKTKRIGNSYRELCFDAHLPQLAAEVVARELKTYVFGEYATVGNGDLPRRIQVYDNRALEVDFHVEELEGVQHWDVGLFEKPEKAVWRPWCGQPEAAKLSGILESEHRFYLLPLLTWSLIYGRVGTDGAWHDLHVVESAGFQNRDNVALDEMRKERGKPATCNGVPVEVELMVHR